MYQNEQHRKYWRVIDLVNVDLDLERRRTLLSGENATDKCYFCRPLGGISVRKMCGLVQRAGHCAIDRGYTEDRETAVITSHYQSQVAV